MNPTELIAPRPTSADERRRRIDHVEKLARERPRAYAVRLALLTGLGYAYVLGMLALACWAAFAALSHLARDGVSLESVLVAGLAGAFAFAVARALVTGRPSPPVGVRVDERRAPALFATLRELRATVGGPRIDEVVIDDALNAWIQQVPRLGPLGFPRHTLILGLPLMVALPEATLRGVLAHELAHLSTADGVAGARAYARRMMWARLAWPTRWTSIVFAPFFAWYAPLFERWTIVRARRHEARADLAAVRAVGAEAAIDGLVRVVIAANHFSEVVVPEVARAVLSEGEDPPEDVVARWIAGLRPPPEPERARAWLAADMTDRTGDADTHPALAERLALMGLEGTPEVPEPCTEPAADALLGEALTAELAAELGRAWADTHGDAWRRTRAQHDADAERLDELDALSERAVLREEERRERALLTQRLRGPGAAHAQLAAALEDEPDDPELRLLVALALAEADDPACVPLFEALIAEDPGGAGRPLVALRAFHTRRGDLAAAARCADALHELRQATLHAHEERARVSDTDAFEPHGLEQHVLDRLVQGLRALPDVAGALLARKTLTHLPQRPCHVLAVMTTFDGRKVFTARAERELRDAVAASRGVQDLPGDCIVVVVNLASLSLRGRLEQVADARVL